MAGRELRLDRNDREEILGRVVRLVEEKFFDPNRDLKPWRELVEQRREQLLQRDPPDEFEKDLHALVSELRVSHVGFFHRSARRVPARLAIGATLQRCEVEDGLRWVFQDVHMAGPAHAAGIERGDVLLTVSNVSICPPEGPTFGMGAKTPVVVRKPDGKQVRAVVDIPIPRSRQLPYCEPQIVTHSIPRSGTGLLKVSVFPGVVGIDVAHALDAAIGDLSSCRRLVVDLRGNPGGGIGGLRLMSYLTPGKLPIGYSLTRRRAKDGFKREDLTKFGRIPMRKIELLPLALRFAFAEKSIALVTEGLGPQPFHGAIAVLVNEHTASASEMIAAFAAENRLATIVGTKTAGRLLSADSFKLPRGYVLTLPVGAYYTWGGRLLEGAGVSPDVPVELSYHAVRAGSDNQLEAALDTVERI
jgi:carboxyl-terminal processing protease